MQGDAERGYAQRMADYSYPFPQIEQEDPHAAARGCAARELVGYENDSQEAVCLSCARKHDPSEWERVYSTDCDAAELTCYACAAPLVTRATAPAQLDIMGDAHEIETPAAAQTIDQPGLFSGDAVSDPWGGRYPQGLFSALMEG